MTQNYPSKVDEVRAAQSRKEAARKLCRSDRLFHDRYRIENVLGRGGFGVTYLARDVALPGEPQCVIKQLSPKVNNPVSLSRAKKRFKREACILGSLGSHSQIPLLLDYFTLDGEFYLVQEYIEGETLTQEIRRTGPQKEAYAKRFLWEILPVVRYVHEQGVIHRDIKPPNIIRAQDNRLVLIDFGAVRERLTEAEEITFHSPNTHFVGTMGFAPPEQLALRPTFASDIYALGVTCLFILTGKSPMEFSYDPRTGDLDWQRSVIEVSPHFANILTRMLKSDVEDRYGSIFELERALALEPYFSQLSDCVNTRSRPAAEDAETLPETVSGYSSKVQQEAAAIRRWRSRRGMRRDENGSMFTPMKTVPAFPL